MNGLINTQSAAQSAIAGVILGSRERRGRRRVEHFIRNFGAAAVAGAWTLIFAQDNPRLISTPLYVIMIVASLTLFAMHWVGARRIDGRVAYLAPLACLAVGLARDFDPLLGPYAAVVIGALVIAGVAGRRIFTLDACIVGVLAPLAALSVNPSANEFALVSLFFITPMAIALLGRGSLFAPALMLLLANFLAMGMNDRLGHAVAALTDAVVIACWLWRLLQRPAVASSMFRTSGDLCVIYLAGSACLWLGARTLFEDAFTVDASLWLLRTELTVCVVFSMAAANVKTAHWPAYGMFAWAAIAGLSATFSTTFIEIAAPYPDNASDARSFFVLMRDTARRLCSWQAMLALAAALALASWRAPVSTFWKFAVGIVCTAYFADFFLTQFLPTYREIGGKLPEITDGKEVKLGDPSTFFQLLKREHDPGLGAFDALRESVIVTAAIIVMRLRARPPAELWWRGLVRKDHVKTSDSVLTSLRSAVTGVQITPVLLGFLRTVGAWAVSLKTESAGFLRTVFYVLAAAFVLVVVALSPPPLWMIASDQMARMDAAMPRGSFAYAALRLIGGGFLVFALGRYVVMPVIAWIGFGLVLFTLFTHGVSESGAERGFDYAAQIGGAAALALAVYAVQAAWPVIQIPIVRRLRDLRVTRMAAARASRLKQWSPRLSSPPVAIMLAIVIIGAGTMIDHQAAYAPAPPGPKEDISPEPGETSPPKPPEGEAKPSAPRPSKPAPGAPPPSSPQ
jgi:hypothetical protein